LQIFFVQKKDKSRKERQEEMNCAGAGAEKNIRNVISWRMTGKPKEITALIAERPEALHRLSSACLISIEVKHAVPRDRASLARQEDYYLRQPAYIPAARGCGFSRRPRKITAANPSCF